MFLYVSEDTQDKSLYLFLKSVVNVLSYFVMEHPGTSIFEGSEGLHLDRSLQHLEEDEVEEDQKRRNKEVLQPVPCSVCVRHTDNI
jgi:hypothetical protein